jgi:adenine-specific DNA-methyltransferase
MKNIAGASGGGEDKKLKKNIEYIHIYAKNYDYVDPFENVYDLIPISQMVQEYRDEGKSWKYTSVLVYEGDKEYFGSTVDGDGNEIKIFNRFNYEIKSINQLMRAENLSEEEAYKRYSTKIFQTQMPQSSIRPRVMEKVKETGSDHDFFSIEYVPKTGRNKGVIYEQFYKGENFRLLAWLRDVAEEIDGTLYKKELQGTYWNFASETKNLTKEGKVQFPNGKKPEALIHRVFQTATFEGDLVLDSFLGSGTSAAVAHKMGRKYIGIELGQHAYTHCFPRLKQVIEGEQSGISSMLKWQGGGGFKFYTLASSLLQKDKYGNWVIDSKYNSAMLAAAMAKQEGFFYSPHASLYWKQGNSSEHDFIYTTTQFITVETLDQIYDEMQPGESLLICCKSFQKECKGKYNNITIKKIPQMLLGRCEFGKEDYSLNIVNMPVDESENDFDAEEEISIQEINDNSKKKNNSEPTLFD